MYQAVVVNWLKESQLLYIDNIDARQLNLSGNVESAGMMQYYGQKEIAPTSEGLSCRVQVGLITPAGATS
jgi:hypothetical protein